MMVPDVDQRQIETDSLLVPAGVTDPSRTRIHCHLRLPYEAKFFALYGGDDGARTRDLCRDRAAL